MTPTEKKSAVSIVVVGAFNPLVYQPNWYAAKGLIPQEEADAAEIEVIHRDITTFNTPGWLLQVTADRFLLQSTAAASFRVIRDLALGTFSELSETPVTAMGINRETTYIMDTEESWNALGWTIVPQVNWDAVMERPSLRAVVIEDVRGDERPGYRRVQLNPVENVLRGVSIQVNDHFEFASPETMADATPVIDVLTDAWDTSITTADRLIQHALTIGQA
ncbi:MAG: hypothetical protein JWN72_1804 [Thermoleophilia bacterium]|nr:hypothetical protein [Thermoleophilia bacterium]